MISLRGRLLAASTTVIAVFVAVTGFALISANHERALIAQQERMKGLVYGLLGATDIGAEGELELFGEGRVDPRFAQPLSGLDAAIYGEAGELLWQSLSAGSDDGPPLRLGVDQWRFVPAQAADDRFVLGYGVRWYDADRALLLTFEVTEDATVFFAEKAAFAQRLWLWLLIPSGLLLLLQLAVLSWALGPLRHMARELRSLEQGRQQALGGAYPQEIAPLARAVNALLQAEQTRRQRFQNALGDLSHSLKTPLAAARALLEKSSPDASGETAEQLERMERIIRFQLARATARAPAAFLPPIPATPVIGRLCRTLGKVHADRRIRLRCDEASACTARIGEDELFEVVGNLLDNACKWAAATVEITLDCADGTTRILIDDDGPGFPDTDLARWLERGARADQHREGQGLGMASAQDILQAAGGRLSLDRSPLGGARILIRIPS